MDTGASVEGQTQNPPADNDTQIPRFPVDVHLSGKSGLELRTEQIATDKPCPIVFITTFEDYRVRTEAMQGEAVDILGKPLDVERLLEVTEQAASKPV